MWLPYIYYIYILTDIKLSKAQMFKVKKKRLNDSGVLIHTVTETVK